MAHAAKKSPRSNEASAQTVRRSLALEREVVAEQRKEIVRLQRLLAKAEVKASSEIAALKAKLTEEKKKIKVVLQHFDRGILEPSSPSRPQGERET